MNEKNKIKILFLVNHFTIGGVQRLNIYLINNLDREKFEVHVLYLKKGILFNEIAEDVFIKNLGNTLNLKSLKNILYIYRVFKYIKLNKIDVIHSADAILYYIGAIASHLGRIKFIRTQPNFIRRHEKLNSKTMRFLPFHRWTTKFITLNKASAKDLAEAGVNNNKISVIYEYYPLNEFISSDISSDIKKEFNIPNNNKIILAMHRMVINKGYETFIDMIPLVLKEYSEVTFLLVGDGPKKKMYESKVDDLGVGSSVVFTGYRTDSANISKQVDFGVYPLADTAAMGTLLRSGKVLITKKNSSMDEYVKHNENGLLVSTDTPQAYAKEVLTLLKNPERIKRMEKNQKQFTNKYLDGMKNIKDFENEVINAL